MDIVETGKVLAKIQAFDNRNVDDPTTIAWQEILEPHILADCLAAVTAYFKTNTAWMMPAHVVERVRDIEQDRLSRFGADPHLSDYDFGNCDDFSESSRALFRAVRTGRLDRGTYDRYHATETTILEVMAAKAISR